MRLRVNGQISPDRVSQLERVIADHGTLERVVGWTLSHEPELEISEIVWQDEFTHDTLIPLPDGLVLAYDCT